MSVLFREMSNAAGFVNPTRSGQWFKRPSKKSHLSHSAMWACVRLRADLVSTLPIDTFRKVAWGQVEVPKPPVLVEPGGSEVDVVEWMYSTQSDLDSVGNTFGLITERDGAGFPRRIDLIAREDVRVQSSKGEITYWVQGRKRDRTELWHERQFTSSGVVIGLSPVAYAALALQQHQSAQEFAAAWFGGGLVPSAHLKYDQATVPAKDSEAIKSRFLVAIENGEPFVTGKDWEYHPIDAAAAQATFIETMRFTDIEVGRFFGVPGDLFDAAVEGSSVTYANITQRNLQFLVHNLGPAINRREKALSKLLPAPRFVKLNSDALLRMDPETVSTMLGQQVKDKLRVPSEARELLNLAPYTPEQIEEFKTLFPTEFKEAPAGAQRGDVK